MNPLKITITSIVASLSFQLMTVKHAEAAWPADIASTAPTTLNRNVSQRLIVKYKDMNSAQSLLRTLASSYKISVDYQFKSLPRLMILEVDPKQAENVAGSLLRESAIEYVERDQQIHLLSIPNDTRYQELWALRNNDFDSDINAEDAWNITQGDTNAVVAVIDSGVAYAHAELKKNMWNNPNEIANDGIDNDGNGIVDDIYGYDAGDKDADPYDDVIGHGTHVAGIIGAQGNNGSLITGINWKTKILACKIFSNASTDLSSYVSAAIECLDYVWDLKQNHGINIIATNNSWGWTGPKSKALQEAIAKQQQAGILFVTAAGNNQIDNDQLVSYPAAYSNSNLISVTSHNQFAEQSLFSNYGSRTVHISAPGEGILSSYPGLAPGAASMSPDAALYFEDFEQGLGDWNYDSAWSLSKVAFAGYQSAVFLADASTQALPLTSPIIDLSNHSDSYTLNLEYKMDAASDTVELETSNDGVAWNPLSTLTYPASSAWTLHRIAIPNSSMTSTFQFRFKPVSASPISTSYSFIVDNISITPSTQRLNDSALRYASGTSMASPAVVGAIALLKARYPDADWKQLKNLIIAGGKPLPTLAKQTISNRRLRLADVDGTGSLTCDKQIVQKRLTPKSNNVIFSSTNPRLHLEFLSIDCGVAMTPGDILIQENNTRIPLSDQGEVGIDQSAGDGVYSVMIDMLSQGLNQLNLQLPDGELIHAFKAGGYQYDKTISFNWRTIEKPMDLALYDPNNEPAYLSTPFPLHFAGKDYDHLYVSLSGLISFYYPRYDILPASINTELPNKIFETMIAPLWNLYTPEAAKVTWGVNGIAPNRELIVQWDVVPADGVSLAANNGTFQLVMFESNSNVLFNYDDLDFGLQSYNNGLSSTIGVQTSSLSANNYGANNHSIDKQSALLWKYDGGPSIDLSQISTDINNNGGAGTGASNNQSNHSPSTAAKKNHDDSGYFGAFDSASAFALFVLMLCQLIARKKSLN